VGYFCFGPCAGSNPPGGLLLGYIAATLWVGDFWLFVSGQSNSHSTKFPSHLSSENVQLSSEMSSETFSLDVRACVPTIYNLQSTIYNLQSTIYNVVPQRSASIRRPDSSVEDSAPIAKFGAPRRGWSVPWLVRGCFAHAIDSVVGPERTNGRVCTLRTPK
jgi:hypothetical protein